MPHAAGIAAGGLCRNFFRRFVQRAANPMAGQIADQRIAALAGERTDRIANAGDGFAMPDLRNPDLHRALTVAAQPLGIFRRPHQDKSWPRYRQKKKPSSEADTSILTKSPSANFWGPGTPCAMASLTLIQVAPGKL